MFHTPAEFITAPLSRPPLPSAAIPRTEVPPPLDVPRSGRAGVDASAIRQLIALLLTRSGLTQAEVARRMALADQSLQQYKSGVRANPSLRWFLRLAHVCGAQVLVEFPAEELS